MAESTLNYLRRLVAWPLRRQLAVFTCLLAICEKRFCVVSGIVIMAIVMMAIYSRRGVGMFVAGGWCRILGRTSGKAGGVDAGYNTLFPLAIMFLGNLDLVRSYGCKGTQHNWIGS